MCLCHGQCEHGLDSDQRIIAPKRSSGESHLLGLHDYIDAEVLDPKPQRCLKEDSKGDSNGWVRWKTLLTVVRKLENDMAEQRGIWGPNCLPYHFDIAKHIRTEKGKAGRLTPGIWCFRKLVTVMESVKRWKMRHSHETEETSHY
jgi:hypothetical protein